MKYLIFPVLVLGLFSCNNEFTSENDNSDELELEQQLQEAVNNNSDSTLSEADKYKWENTKIEFGSPIVLNSTQNIAIPIVLEDIYKDKITTTFKYFNMAIINENNEFKKYLFEESVVIHYISTIEEEMESMGDYYDRDDEIFSDLYNSLVLMKVSKFINGKESGAQSLYVYNLEKDELHQLTPDGHDVKSWSVYRDVSKLVIRVAADTDNNGEFDSNDSENIVVVDPNNPANSEPIFNIDELKKIKTLVLEEN